MLCNIFQRKLCVAELSPGSEARFQVISHLMSGFFISALHGLSVLLPESSTDIGMLFSRRTLYQSPEESFNMFRLPSSLTALIFSIASSGRKGLVGGAGNTRTSSISCLARAL